MTADRYTERGIALYWLGTGLLFTLRPETLDPMVYLSWGALAPEQWGALALLGSIALLAASWLNGFDRLISAPVRALAAFWQLGLSVCFAWMFWASGLLWGAVLFGFFLPYLTIPLVERALTTFLQVRNGKVVRHGRH